MPVRAPIALHADRTHIREQHDRALPDLLVEPRGRELGARDRIGLAQRLEPIPRDFADDADAQSPQASPSAARLAGTYEFEDGSTITIAPSTGGGGGVTLTGRGQTALERLTHGDLFDPNWTAFYAQMNERAVEVARAISARDTTQLLEFMERGTVPSQARAIIDTINPPQNAPAIASLGTVTLADATVSFVEGAGESVIALHWRGRDLISATSQSPEQAIAIEAHEIRSGVYEGPGADGASSVRFSFDQPGDGPILSVKLLPTRSAGAVTGKRVKE